MDGPVAIAWTFAAIDDCDVIKEVAESFDDTLLVGDIRHNQPAASNILHLS
jgi:hypothetical protein